MSQTRTRISSYPTDPIETTDPLTTQSRHCARQSIPDRLESTIALSQSKLLSPSKKYHRGREEWGELGMICDMNPGVIKMAKKGPYGLVRVCDHNASYLCSDRSYTFLADAIVQLCRHLRASVRCWRLCYDAQPARGSDSQRTAGG